MVVVILLLLREFTVRNRRYLHLDNWGRPLQMNGSLVKVIWMDVELLGSTVTAGAIITPYFINNIIHHIPILLFPPLTSTSSR